MDGNATDGTPTGTDGCPAPDKDALSVSGDANVCIPAPAVAIALGVRLCCSATSASCSDHAMHVLEFKGFRVACIRASSHTDEQQT